MKKILISSLVVSAIAVSFAGITLAQTPTPTPIPTTIPTIGPPEQAPFGIPTGPQSGIALRDVVLGVIDWLFVALLLAATIFIVLAGFQFLTYGGDAAKLTEARQKLIYAVIAVVVALFARSVPAVITAIIGA